MIIVKSKVIKLKNKIIIVKKFGRKTKNNMIIVKNVKIHNVSFADVLQNL